MAGGIGLRVWGGLLSFPCNFLCYFFGALHFFLEQAWVGGEGVLATQRHCTDSVWETDYT